MDHIDNQKTGSKKNLYVIIGLTVVLLGAVGLYFLRGTDKTVQKKVVKKKVFENSEVIPTVDASVKVSVKTGSSNKKFNLIIAGIPSGTRSLEYVVTYETKAGELPGISGTVDITDDSGNFEKKDLLLGTCSSGGACVYHELAGPLSVTVKFSGSYGERLFENAFEL